MSEPTPMETDMGPTPKNSQSEEIAMITAVSPETAEIFDRLLGQIIQDSPMDAEKPTPTIPETDTPKSIQEEVNMDNNSRDDAGSSTEERPIKRQRLSEELAAANESSPSKAGDTNTPLLKVKVPREEQLAFLQTKLAKLAEFEARRELSDVEGWLRDEYRLKITVLQGNLNTPGPKDESSIKDEGDVKEQEKKMGDMKAEETLGQKPPATSPKRTSTKKKITTSTKNKATKPPLNPAEKFWGKYYQEDKGPKKRKHGPSIEDLVNNSNSTEARAARGEIQLAESIERTNDREDAIKSMTGPDLRRGDPATLRFSIQSLGKKQVKPDLEGAKWKVAGIATSLYSHQVVGVSGMLRLEFNPTNGPTGGILADEMGLGKTLQLLTMMRCNRPTNAERKNNKHTTLIVVPASALRQWLAEIKRHVEEKKDEKSPKYNLDNYDDDDDEEETGFRIVMHFKRRNFPDSLDDHWKSADVIVTSYWEIQAAYPSKKKILEIKKRKLSPEEEKKRILKECDSLLTNKYFRVVLDEGHAIKNYDSTTSKACLLLDAKRKWILTGTPMHNSSEELFPYFEFLGLDPGVGPPPGKSQTGKGKAKEAGPQKDMNEARYYTKLNKTLRDVMIRRHVNEKFLGNDILQIPQNHPTEIIKVELPDAERMLFKQLELRYHTVIEEVRKNGGMDLCEFRAFIVIAITRLRQIVSHPYLLEKVIGRVFTHQDFAELEARFAAAGDNIPANSRIWKLIQQGRGIRIGDANDTTSAPEGSMRAIIAADPLGSAAMKGDGDDIDEVFCGHCEQLPDDLVTTKCNHMFCRDCLAGEVKMNGCRCPKCDTSLDESDPSKDFQHDAEETVVVSSKAVGAKKGKGQDKGKTQKKEHGEDELFFQPGTKRPLSMVKAYDRDYDQHNSNKMVDGAKLLAARNHIIKWQSEAPDDKIIAFTQYNGTAAILGRILAEEGIQFVYFSGELSMAKKENAITKFFEDPNVKVMIASLKCGGQALNLTCANRVMIIDPWWNAAMEKQAFGRVARIGQKKETYLAKFVVNGTMDVDMLNVQGMKDEDIYKTLQEKDPVSGGTVLGTKLLRGLVELKMTRKKQVPKKNVKKR